MASTLLPDQLMNKMKQLATKEEMERHRTALKEIQQKYPAVKKESVLFMKNTSTASL